MMLSELVVSIVMVFSVWILAGASGVLLASDWHWRLAKPWKVLLLLAGPLGVIFIVVVECFDGED